MSTNRLVAVGFHDGCVFAEPIELAAQVVDRSRGSARPAWCHHLVGQSFTDRLRDLVRDGTTASEEEGEEKVPAAKFDKAGQGR